MATENLGPEVALHEVLKHIEEKREEAQRAGMTEASIQALGEAANQLSGRTVRISGILTNHELAYALEVPPVEKLAICIGGAAVRTEDPKEWPLIGSNFPVVEFSGETLLGVRQPEGLLGATGCKLVGELHEKGVTVIEALDLHPMDKPINWLRG